MSERKLQTPIEVADTWFKSPSRFLHEAFAADRRALVEALLAECPVCENYTRAPDAKCHACEWVRAFAAREGLASGEWSDTNVTFPINFGPSNPPPEGGPR